MLIPDTPTTRRPRVKTEGPQNPSDQLTIGMEIDDAGRPFCNPYYAHVLRGSRVKWNFDGAWTIIFKGRTPLRGKQFTVNGYGDMPEVKVAEDAPAAHYPYSVIVVGVDNKAFGGPTPTIFFDLACPEMIIG